MTNTKTFKGRCSKFKKLDRRMRSLLSDKRAISVTLSTLILTAGVIAAGIAIMYWAYSWGAVANQQYSNSVANSTGSIEESIAFEYITYSNNSLTVYLINNGLGNVSLFRLYLWNAANSIIGTYPIPVLQDITSNLQLHTSLVYNTTLSIGEEGYFVMGNLTSLSGYYTMRVVTASGRNFDGSFSTP